MRSMRPLFHFGVCFKPVVWRVVGSLTSLLRLRSLKARHVATRRYHVRSRALLLVWSTSVRSRSGGSCSAMSTERQSREAGDVAAPDATSHGCNPRCRRSVGTVSAASPAHSSSRRVNGVDSQVLRTRSGPLRCRPSWRTPSHSAVSEAWPCRSKILRLLVCVCLCV